MDTKKTIGAVVGVIAFIALIAGATFAWFTASATVTNATYNGTVCSYSLTVTGGNINTSLPLASSTASSALCRYDPAPPICMRCLRLCKS